MKTIKKIKKSTKAVAGSALLVGATLAGGASMALAQDSGSSGDSYDLGSYPSDFVDEDGNLASSIVVGEDAKAADVVSAIDIAAQLGNDAFAEEEQTVEGAETTEVNGLEAQTTVRSALNGGDEVTLDKSDYDGLLRTVVEDEDGDEHRVLEQIRANVNSNTISTQVESGETTTSVPQNSLQYEVSYTPGYESGDSLWMLGEEYSITEVGNTHVDLGSEQTTRNLATGDTVEHGPWEVEVTDNDGENTVYLTIMEDGDVVSEDTFDTDDSMTYGENDQFKVTADSIFFGNEERVTLSTVYTDTTVEEGEDVPVDSDYTVTEVDSDGTTVTGLTFENTVRATASMDTEEDNLNDNQVYRLGEGDNFEGPAGYFSLNDMGLEDVSTEDITFGEGESVTFTDKNALENEFDFENLVGDFGVSANDVVGVPETSSGDNYYPVEVTEVENNANGNGFVNVTVTYQGFEEEEISVDAEEDNDAEVNYVETGYGFSVAVSANDDNSNGEIADTVKVGGYDSSSYQTASEEVTTDFGATLTHLDSTGSYSASDSGVQVAETGSVNTFVHYENGGNIVAVDDDGDDSTTSPYQLEDTDDGESTVTNHGSMVELSSDSSASVTYPEESREIDHAYGSVDTESTDGQTYTERTPTDPTDVAALDTDDDIESRQASGDNMVLVGGPSVNDLVEDLAGDDLTWSTDEYNDGEGLLQSISTDAYDALLVSGESAEDTRAAGEYLVNYEENSEQLEGSSQLRISTENGQVVESGDDSSESEDSQ